MAYLFQSSAPPPTYRKIDKVQPDCKVGGKCLVFHSNILISLTIAEFRTPTPQDVREKGSKNSETTAGSQLFYINNDKKLVVIINSLKYQKLRKFYYMK